MWLKMTLNKDKDKSKRVICLTKEAEDQLCKQSIAGFGGDAAQPQMSPGQMVTMTQRARKNPYGAAARGLGSLMYPKSDPGSPISKGIRSGELSPEMMGVGRSSRRFGDWAGNIAGLALGEDSVKPISDKVRYAANKVLGTVEDWTGWTPESSSREEIRNTYAAVNPGQELSVEGLEGKVNTVIDLVNNNQANYGLGEVAPGLREMAQVDPTVATLFRSDASPAEKKYAYDKADGVLMASRIMGVPPARAVKMLHKRLGNLSDYTGNQIATMVQKQKTYDQGLYS